jgi:hypothetical protein
MFKTKKKFKVPAFDINGDGVVNFDDVLAVFNGTRYYQSNSPGLVKEKVKKIWDRNKHHFDVLSVKIQARSRKGRSVFTRLISRSDNKIEKVILNLLDEFNDEHLTYYRDDYARLNKRILENESKIASLRAASILEESQKYTHSITKMLNENDKYDALKKRAVEYFVKRFALYGIELSEEHAETIISRVDVDEITQMNSVFYVISELLQQLSEAKKHTNEDLNISKKYYAIFIGLLELQIYIQNSYIKKVTTNYLPKLLNMKSAAEALSRDTRAILKRTEKDYKEAYHSNIQSQELSIKVIKIYVKILEQETACVRNAMSLLRSRLELAKNTLNTVTIAAELSSLIKRNDKLYLDVMELQTPDLIGFSNLEMKKEFQRLTEKLMSIN